MASQFFAKILKKIYLTNKNQANACLEKIKSERETHGRDDRSPPFPFGLCSFLISGIGLFEDVGIYVASRERTLEASLDIEPYVGSIKQLARE